jgi:glucuronosyltransferase
MLKNIKMNNRAFLILTVLVASFVQSCSSAKIVVLYTVSTKSHMYAVMPAIEELAQRGHQVSIFSSFQGMAKNVKNGREFFLKEAAQLVDETEVDWFSMQKEGLNQFLTMMRYVKQMSLTSCNNLLTHPDFLEILRKREVDLFIVDGYFHEFLFPIFDHIGVPFVTHSSNSAFPNMLAAMGASKDYAFVSTSIVQLDDPITFPRRLLNVMLNEISRHIRTHYILKDLDALLQSHIPGVRSIAEVEGEASLCIINSHPMTNWPRSLPPTIVPIGALHTRPAKSLPKVIRNLVLVKKQINNLDLNYCRN